MMEGMPFAIAVVLGLCLGGCAKTLRVDSVGYEVRAPSGFFLPLAAHEEWHMAMSLVGPVDFAVTRFAGGSEVYYVVGMRSPVFRKTEEVLRALRAGLVAECEKSIGTVSAGQRIDRPDALGEEFVVTGTRGEHKGRVMRLRLYAAAGCPGNTRGAPTSQPPSTQQYARDRGGVDWATLRDRERTVESMAVVT